MTITGSNLNYGVFHLNARRSKAQDLRSELFPIEPLTELAILSIPASEYLSELGQKQSVSRAAANFDYVCMFQIIY